MVMEKEKQLNNKRLKSLSGINPYNQSQETKLENSHGRDFNSNTNSSPNTFKEPLDKKEKRITDINEVIVNYPMFFKENVKSSLSNLKKRLKEWVDNNLGCIDDCGECDMCRQALDFYKEIDKLFLEEIGKGLLGDENVNCI